jgi:hypothetical protein
MENLVNTLVTAAVLSAVFPIAFLLARLCLAGLVRWLPTKTSRSKRMKNADVLL